MHPLYDYIAKQVAERLKARQVVVWYDPRGEFRPFVAELGADAGGARVQPVRLGEFEASLAGYAGSMFELRAAVEPLVAVDSPAPLLVYLPGVTPAPLGSVLMELEKAGDRYEPQLKRLARNVLRQRYTDGVIDGLLASEGVTYEDLARACSDESPEPPSILKTLFHPISEPPRLLAQWLADSSRDAAIEEKGAGGELAALVRTRIGLDLPAGRTLSQWRAITTRYVLAAEFRSDLQGAPPASIAALPAPPSNDAEATVRQVARTLRQDHADAYPGLADQAEAELNLRDASLDPEALGSIDTFRFEEGVLLAHCGRLIASKAYDAALRVITERERSFWLDRDTNRKAQWEACRRMADLGRRTGAVKQAVAQARGGPDAWVHAYVGRPADDGEAWYRLDQAQRRLESWVASLADEPEEKPLAVVRRAYEEACHEMAAGFTKALAAAGWSVPGVLHQTRVHADVVSALPRPVAYFLVDALRFEMGADLAQRLPADAEVSVRPTAAALPTITPVGMAALQPGASSSFSVAERDGRLGAMVDDVFLPDLAARRKFAASRVPGAVDLTLDTVLSLKPSKLLERVAGASLVIVRSQEIDQAGEGGFAIQARQTMDSVIGNIVHAIKRLATAGVVHAVVAADHGHLFFATDRDESLRIDSPGGHQVELHRRCWIGRGGWTPTACERVSASALGYASDLDFVFPVGCGVFKAGGDLAYHHGGPSLQELVVPVISVRSAVPSGATGDHPELAVSGLPPKVTNRIFSVTAELASALFTTPTTVRPLLMASTRQVGALGMAVGAECDMATGTVTLEPGKTVSLALLLTDDTVPSVRVVVQDPSSDAELYRSPAEIPVQLGV
jgi:hypothetical protein